MEREHAPRTLREFGGVLAAIAVCQAAGLIGTFATREGTKEWYPSLDKPPFNPPSAVFAPVWTLLYTLMGISGWLLWQHRDHPEAKRAGTLFAIQLVLNSFWTFVFFRFKAPGWALIEITVLLVAIVMTIATAWRISRLAGLLLVPYLLWTGFALVLNGSIWWLNRNDA